MTTWPQTMKDLAADVRGLDPNRTVDAVVQRLSEIEDGLDGYYSNHGGGPKARAERRPLPNGVACFNGLYLQVTKAVAMELAANRFEAPGFVARLDVIFAEFYFRAYDAAAGHQWVSKAWAPLFEDKDNARIIPLQYAIAGMNAHINNDLSHALVQTWRELDNISPGPNSPEYRDFEIVNEILAQVEKDVKGPLATDIIGVIDEWGGEVDDWLGLWSVAKARGEAWERAEKMRTDPDADYVKFIDRFVGFASHLLLVPMFGSQ